MSGKLLLSTQKDAVLSNRPGFDMTCNHPEANTRIILHLARAGTNAHKKTFVWTVVTLAFRFNTLGLTELWISFAGGKNYRDIPAHEISKGLGPQKSLAWPLVHALTGWDTTSAFLGHGKKSLGSLGGKTRSHRIPVTLTMEPERINNDIHVQRLERCYSRVDYKLL